MRVQRRHKCPYIDAVTLWATDDGARHPYDKLAIVIGKQPS